jgi:hypothetical protein
MPNGTALQIHFFAVAKWITTFCASKNIEKEINGQSKLEMKV